MHDRYLVGEPEHHLHVVLDQQRGHARFLEEPRQRLHGLNGLLHGQPLRRLVEQKHLGLLRHRHRDLEEPLVALAEQAGWAARNIAETELLERGVAGTARLREDAGAAKGLPAPPIAGLRRQRRIGACRHLGKQRRQLERPRQPSLADAVRLQAGDVGAGKAHAARGRLHHPGDQVEQRGLAGAVGPDDGANLADGDLHADVVDGDECAIALGQAVNLDEGRGHPIRSPLGRPWPCLNHASRPPPEASRHVRGMP